MKKIFLCFLIFIFNTFDVFAIIPASEEDLKKEYKEFVGKLPAKNIQNMLNAYYFNDGDIYREMAIEECENIGEFCYFNGVEPASKCIKEKIQSVLDTFDSNNFDEKSYIRFNRLIESSMNYCGSIYLNPAF